MESYGIQMAGSFVVEKVPALPTWSANDPGRVVYVITDGTYWLPSYSNTIGNAGWIPLGLLPLSVKDYHIDWDINMTDDVGKVSSVDLPASYRTVVSNAQTVFTTIQSEIDGIKSGDTIAAGAIKDFHIDWTGVHRVSSIDIPFDNVEHNFVGSDITVEDVINMLADRTAADIKFSNSTTFGQNLGFSTASVQAGMESIENWLFNLSAQDIPCSYLGCQCNTNVQFALDSLYTQLTGIKIIDLVDVPNYSAEDRYLKSNGVDCMSWVTLNANDIECQYPKTTKNNVQAFIWSIEDDIDDLTNRLNNLHIHARDVEYTTGEYPSIANVNDMLDYINNHFYSDGNPETAAECPCSPIGGQNNVQGALTYLYNEIVELQSMIPCFIDACNVTYNSPSGATNVCDTLTWILNNCCGSGNTGGTGGTGSGGSGGSTGGGGSITNSNFTTAYAATLVTDSGGNATFTYPGMNVAAILVTVDTSTLGISATGGGPIFRSVTANTAIFTAKCIWVNIAGGVCYCAALGT